MPSLLTVAGTGLQGWVISFNSLQLVQQAQISVHMHVHLKGGRICVPANVQIGGTWLEELGLYLFTCLAR